MTPGIVPPYSRRRGRQTRLEGLKPEAREQIMQRATGLAESGLEQRHQAQQQRVTAQNTPEAQQGVAEDLRARANQQRQITSHGGAVSRHGSTGGLQQSLSATLDQVASNVGARGPARRLFQPVRDTGGTGNKPPVNPDVARRTGDLLHPVAKVQRPSASAYDQLLDRVAKQMPRRGRPRSRAFNLQG